MNKQIILGALISVILVISLIWGFISFYRPDPNNAITKIPDNPSHSDHGSIVMPSKFALGQSPYKVILSTNQLSQSGRGLQVSIYDSTNKKQTNFDTNHGGKLHLIAVKDDFSDYHHLHPEIQGDGSFVVDYNFDKTGKYKLFADFIVNAKNSVVAQDIAVN
jgi:hypothetical protein